MHFLRKLCSTMRLAVTLALARTFGTYEHSVTDGGLSYARYNWRGQDWPFPTGPIEDL